MGGWCGGLRIFDTTLKNRTYGNIDMLCFRLQFPKLGSMKILQNVIIHEIIWLVTYLLHDAKEEPHTHD